MTRRQSRPEMRLESYQVLRTGYRTDIGAAYQAGGGGVLAISYSSVRRFRAASLVSRLPSHDELAFFPPGHPQG